MNFEKYPKSKFESLASDLQLREWREYLYVVLMPQANGDARLFSEMGDGVQELIESLGEHIGESIAIGPCPNFIADDSEAMISRSKGGIDGPR